MSDKYDVRIVARGFQQSADDYHATVTRRSDGVALIWTAAWRWLLKWRVRRGALDRAFARYDERQAKLAMEEFFQR